MPKALRGEIWAVDFHPARGAEIQKVRPAVVLNHADVGRLPLCIVVPITEWQPGFAEFSWFVSLRPSSANGLAKASGAGAFQVKSVSEQRFLRRLGSLPETEVELIADAVAFCIGA